MQTSVYFMNNQKKSNINSSLCNLLKLVIGIKYSRIPEIEWLLMSSVYWGLLHSLQYSLTFVWVSSWARIVGPWGHGCTKKSPPIGYYKYLATNIFFCSHGRTNKVVRRGCFVPKKWFHLIHGVFQKNYFPQQTRVFWIEATPSRRCGFNPKGYPDVVE